jgi:hypothetical protein
MIIDANGSDISKVMHSINFAYAQYYNAVHKRHGHLFQDRFKSKIITDERYLLTLSAYIHKNPTDILKYQNCPEKYEFSSLSIYLGLKRDPYGLVDDGFIMSMFGRNPRAARERYIKLVFICSDEKTIKNIEFTDEGTEYRSQRKILVRNTEAQEIIEFIIKKMGVCAVKLHSKNSKNLVEAKALLVFMMRSLCNYKCSTICKVLGNITQGRVSMLSSIGIKLIDDDKYSGLVNEFMENYAV